MVSGRYPDIKVLVIIDASLPVTGCLRIIKSLRCSIYYIFGIILVVLRLIHRFLITL